VVAVRGSSKGHRLSGIEKLNYQQLNQRYDDGPAQDYHRQNRIRSKYIAGCHNLDFSEWGTLFASPGTAAALLDRLLHHARVITLRGDNYRVRNRLVPPKPTKPEEGDD